MSIPRYLAPFLAAGALLVSLSLSAPGGMAVVQDQDQDEKS